MLEAGKSKKIHDFWKEARWFNGKSTAQSSGRPVLFFQSRHEPRDKSFNLSEPQFLQEKMEEILLILASPAWSMGRKEGKSYVAS